MDAQRSESKDLRKKILDVASELFYQEGLRAVGVDTIVEKADVAKMTLYKYFKSKDELIEAYLRRSDEDWRHWFWSTVEARASKPKERLLAIFDVMQGWFEASDFRGCPFINASMEIADCQHLGRKVSLEHSQHMLSDVLKITRGAKVSDPETLAQQILLLMNGAIVSAVMTGNANAAQEAKQALVILLKAN